MDESQHGNEKLNDVQVDGRVSANGREVVVKEEANAATASPASLAASLEFAKREVASQEIAVFKLWQEGKYAAAQQQVLGVSEANENLARLSDELAQLKAKTAIQAQELAASGYPGKPRGELNDKSSALMCQGECGTKFSSFGGKAKRGCKSCGFVVCEDCSPPPKVNVLGYSEPQRVCTKCIQAQGLKLQELDTAASDAAKQSASAREFAQKFKADELGTAADADGGSTVAFLENGLRTALADDDLGLAAFLKQKAENVRAHCSQRVKLLEEQAVVRTDLNVARCNELEAELKALPTAIFSVVVALEAFPVGTVVRASVAGTNDVAAGTAGEVVGYTPKGEVEVRFSEGAAVFAVASLHVADLTNGWISNQTCFSAVDVAGEVAIGQSGRVMGWSKPFDRDKLMVDFNGQHVNVLLSQLKSAEQFREKSLRERQEAERALYRTIAKVEAQKQALKVRLEVARAADPDAAVRERTPFLFLPSLFLPSSVYPASFLFDLFY